MESLAAQTSLIAMLIGGFYPGVADRDFSILAHKNRNSNIYSNTAQALIRGLDL
ncbi:MAG: hypothetical protein UV00_C0010G0009 [candidate division WWE3 bacterium GW2011_GWF1_42_14]|uniref:Uncharacterized protein n=1 Tax=candidate division WWE3 bacterium GW2011_GWF1_42_14 TaxID=1619138 RepID=A0A0G0YMD7_UNCKA|nr:MAG: hypothetical protein UU92_C0011G0008 [candidate division WWE3 bacterium GW2011_GWA1_42_12]KKS34460.1 MAG: hypothetical protein UU97_C0010G0007 [candidate division WWE3 bacterium GW2011_GWD1_42_14]KKS37937.1 MAG: hypothetical protein UV00_C0010G0009 [candidate division WWE3 bacterium GW2011_GWF1_42_14]KKS40244.1 MAG: hypothetical protein UV03_C0009G0007 [candidate division WWE3 bacterium GW2011_GWE1_42_16]